MILFVILEAFTVSAMYHRSYSTLSVVTAWGSALQIFLYFLVALSNPGILTKELILQEEEWEGVNVDRLSRYFIVNKDSVSLVIRRCYLVVGTALTVMCASRDMITIVRGHLSASEKTTYGNFMPLQDTVHYF